MLLLERGLLNNLAWGWKADVEAAARAADRMKFRTIIIDRCDFMKNRAKAD